jgi:hypothetical protein
MTPSCSCAFSLFAILLSTAAVQVDVLNDLFSTGRPVIDLRGRYEGVDDASKTFNANAVILRARLGYETGSWNGLSL